MMSKTFDKDSEDTHRIWIFPFASLVLRYERMLSAQQQAQHRSGVAAAPARSPPTLRPVPSTAKIVRIGASRKSGGKAGFES